MRFKAGLFLTAMAALGLAGAPAQAADIPCGTAKLIVPWGAGGGTDVIFRTFVDAANRAGADPQIQVVNISGQGGNKGAKEAKAAEADGCTLFAVHQSAITSYFNGRVDFAWDVFTPVALLTRTPPIYGANPDVSYDNIKQLVETAKEKPGEITAGGTPGSTSQFWFLLLEDAAGVKFKHVPYDGTRERMTALLAKNIQVGEINLAAAEKYITSGELKALGIATEERNPRISDVPTLKEQGYDLVFGTDRGVVLPPDASQELVDHYAEIFLKAAKDSKVQESMKAKGTQVMGLGSDKYQEYMTDTLNKWREIAIEVGMFKKDK